jgi:hypothetical protein
MSLDGAMPPFPPWGGIKAGRRSGLGPPILQGANS